MVSVARLKLLSVLLLFLVAGTVSAAESPYNGNFSFEDYPVEEDQQQEDQENHPVLYIVFWIAGQLALVYSLGIFFFEEGDISKAISIVGIMVPWLFFANLAPFGFIIGLWGYFSIVKFRFDTTYPMAGLVVVPIYAYQFFLQLLFM